MSKSEGNFVTIRELLENWNGIGWPGEALRFNMLRTHYKQPIDWTVGSLDESHRSLWEWYGAIEKLDAEATPPDQILDALSDDLNTPQAIAVLHEMKSKGDLAGLASSLRFLGFSGKKQSITRIQHASVHISAKASLKAEVDVSVAARLEARKARNFAESDRIREELAAKGIILNDGKDPATGEPTTTWEIAR